MNIQDFREKFVSVAICNFVDSFKFSYFPKREVWDGPADDKSSTPIHQSTKGSEFQSTNKKRVEDYVHFFAF
jgi:hypothetical protein